jgi:hypothetical protein
MRREVRECLSVFFFVGADEIDSPIQIPSLEAPIDRKNCPSNKAPSQYVGTDCAGTIRITDSKVCIVLLFFFAIGEREVMGFGC